jgi:hypothetical protein
MWPRQKSGYIIDKFSITIPVKKREYANLCETVPLTIH